MKLQVLDAFFAAAAILIHLTPAVRANNACDPSNFGSKDIITRDVAIIGGGSAGTYSAFRLQDYKQSIVVIEELDLLGGHTQTYKDPQTGITQDIGVQVWHNLTIVTNYFNRLNVTLISNDLLAPLTVTSYTIDLATGLKVPARAAVDPSTAFPAYLTWLNQYPGLINGFDLPDPVPEDLLLPWGQFLQKYELQALSDVVFSIEQGYGQLLGLPTLYVVKQFTQDLIRSIGEGFVTTKDRDNHELYDAAQSVLESEGNVLLSAKIIAIDRDAPDYARIVVKTPSGTKLIQAKKVLFAIPPWVPAISSFWDFDALEFSLFSQFQHCGYYTGLINNTGLPANITITNTGTNNNTYDFPSLPGAYIISQSRIPNLYSVYYGTPNTIGFSPSEAQVKADITAELKRLRNSGFQTTDNPNFPIFSSHAPFLLNVPVSAIKGGFYKKLNTLQGHRRTWYTGATWQTHDSSAIWNFTESILPAVVKG